MSQDKLKIVFWGTSDFTVPAFEALIKENYNIVAAVTQPDKLVGRKQILSPSLIKSVADQYNTKVLQPKTLKDDETFKLFKLLHPDLCIVTAYGKIIPPRYLEIPKYGFLNIHPSLLPKYRGPSPVQTAILNGDSETGISIMLVDNEVDHGPILENRKWKIESGKYYKELEKELAELGAKLLIETLPNYINGEIKPEPQDHSRATFTKMFSRIDGRINWDEPTDKIYNQIRALNPEPGTWTTWFGKVINIFNITTCDIVSLQLISGETPPGTVQKINGGIVVATGDGFLALELIQLEGGKEMTIREFVNGHRGFVGSVLK